MCDPFFIVSVLLLGVFIGITAACKHYEKEPEEEVELSELKAEITEIQKKLERFENQTTK